MKTLLLAAALFLTTPAFAQGTRILSSNNSASASTSLEYSVRKNEIQTGGAVSFEPGTATLSASSEGPLQTIVKYLSDKTYISTLRIEGHTVCGNGDQALSEARAKTVADWLIKNGVECKRLVAAGFGCSKPILADHAEMNERITFVNAALRGHLIGGMPADGGGKTVSVDCAPEDKR